MVSHSYHEQISTHGLNDECDRCWEIAQNPFEDLDDKNLSILLVRIEKKLPSRSANESRVMKKINETIYYFRRIEKLQQQEEYEKLEYDKKLIFAAKEGRNEVFD